MMNADRIKELADAALAIAISGHAEIAALRDAVLASAAPASTCSAIQVPELPKMPQTDHVAAWPREVLWDHGVLTGFRAAGASAAVPVAAQEPATDELRAMLNKTESPWLHYELSKQIAALAAQEPAQPVAWMWESAVSGMPNFRAGAERPEGITPKLRPLYAASPAPAAPDPLVEEYEAWIRFFNAGNGDYTDFLRSRGLT